MSEDLMQSQVGPLTAAHLSIPCAVSVTGSELKNDFSGIKIISELEGGMTEHIDVTLPCLITVQSGVNRPRYPSLSNVMAARTMSIITIDSHTLINTACSDETISLEYPAISPKGIVLDGNIEEKAERFLNILHEKGVL